MKSGDSDSAQGYSAERPTGNFPGYLCAGFE